MTIQTIAESQRKAAKAAGLANLLAMVVVIYTNYAIYGFLIVTGHGAETARNIMAHEQLFRVGIACDLIYAGAVVVLLTALYTILKPVSPSLALLALVCRLVYALMWMVTALSHLEILRLLSGADYLQVFDTDRLQTLMRLRFGTSFDAYYVGLPFYGLASTVCCYLWFKSNYIPRVLAVVGVIASAWCALSSFTFIIFPQFGNAINLYSLDTPIGIFEITLSFWLVFKGLKPPVITKFVEAS